MVQGYANINESRRLTMAINEEINSSESMQTDEFLIHNCKEFCKKYRGKIFAVTNSSLVKDGCFCE